MLGYLNVLFFSFFFYTLLSKIIVTSGRILLDMFQIPIVTTGGGFESWMSMLETPRGVNQLSYKTLGNWTFFIPPCTALQY